MCMGREGGREGSVEHEWAASARARDGGYIQKVGSVSFRVFGEEEAIIKCHELMHFADFYRRFGCLPTCWVNERKHKCPKRWINPITNTKQSFDKSAFHEVTATHIASMIHTVHDLGVGLLPPVGSPPRELLASLHGTLGAQEILSAHAARVNEFEVIHVDDVTEGYNGDSHFLGRVKLHLSVDGKIITILETWRCSKSSPDFTEWDTSDPQLALVYTDDLLTRCIHAVAGNLVTALRSSRSRRFDYALHTVSPNNCSSRSQSLLQPAL